MPVESTTPEHAWKRLDGVDILRGLAIFFVLMNHVNMRLWGAKIPYTKGLPHQLVSSLVWNGQFGVQIFFVVSGFLITSTTLRRWGSPSSVNVRDFYLLRFARIAPLLLLLLAVLSGLHLAHVNNFVVSHKKQEGLEERSWQRSPSTSLCSKQEEITFPATGISSGRSPSKRYSISSSR